MSDPAAKPVIVIVDDELVQRRTVMRELERRGYEALDAASAEDALAIIQQRTADVLFTTINLPRMKGDVLAVRAVQITPGLRVIYASHHSGEMKLDPLAPQGPFLQKPYYFADLAAALEAVGSSATPTTR